ncbi:MAG: T9SS type A sorting domain-containing protein [Flavobacteriaceae bacterium]|nr:T9SS type A sorting domain-containing protein [Flavobacteriaceae bacterium]
MKNISYFTLFALLFLGLSVSAQINFSEGFEDKPDGTLSGDSYTTYTDNLNVVTSDVACTGAKAVEANILYNSEGQSSPIQILHTTTASNGNTINISFKYSARPKDENSAVKGHIGVLCLVSTGGDATFPIEIDGDVNCEIFSETIPAGIVPVGATFTFAILNFGAPADPNEEIDWFLTIDDIVLSQASLGVDDVTSVNEESVAVYPNPVKDILNIKSEKEVSDITIYSIEGKLVKHSKVSGDTVDVSSLGKGVYLLNITLKDGEKVSRKFIKE